MTTSPITGAGYSLGTSSSVQTTAQMSSMSSVSMQVGEMMQSIGGGAENDKMLQMMIALMIFMSILQNQNQSGGQGSDMLSQLGGGSFQSVEMSSVSISSSTTTMSYETYGAEMAGELDVVA